MNRLLFFDTETGGLDTQRHSLLSMGLVVGRQGQVEDACEILVRHEPYVVTAGGLRVNRIDLVRHHDEALDPPAALGALDAFLQRHYAPDEPIVLAGHNVGFDRAFLGRFLEAQGRELEPRFSHRTVDTHTIAAFLRDAGRLPVPRLGATTLFEHFGIVVPEGRRHTALGDALATFELYHRLLELLP